MNKVIKEVEGFYKIVELNLFRETEGVQFDTIPASLMPEVASLDIVRHDNGAVSPGTVGEVKHAWYMHPCQDDNLIVLDGARTVEVFKPGYGPSVKVRVEERSVYLNDEKITSRPAMLVWYRGVFHRVVSEEEGSLSINLAVHHEGFDLKTNFNIYDLNMVDGSYTLLRKGELDQHGE